MSLPKRGKQRRGAAQQPRLEMTVGVRTAFGGRTDVATAEMSQLENHKGNSRSTRASYDSPMTLFAAEWEAFEEDTVDTADDSAPRRIMSTDDVVPSLNVNASTFVPLAFNPMRQPSVGSRRSQKSRDRQRQLNSKKRPSSAQPCDRACDGEGTAPHKLNAAAMEFIPSSESILKKQKRRPPAPRNPTTTLPATKLSGVKLVRSEVCIGAADLFEEGQPILPDAASELVMILGSMQLRRSQYSVCMLASELQHDFHL